MLTSFTVLYFEFLINLEMTEWIWPWLWFDALSLQVWAMSVCAALLNRHVAGGCHRLLCGVPQLLVHIRSASETEAGTRRSDEEHVWEEANYLPFSRARIGSFFQERPVLRNPFLEDALLRGYLRRHLPQQVSTATTWICWQLLDRINLVLQITNVNVYVFTSQAAFSDLCAFGERVANEVDTWGRECELTPPQLKHFDPWGNRVDHIVTSSAWKRMKDLSAQEGLVAIGYERPCGEWRSEGRCTSFFQF